MTRTALYSAEAASRPGLFFEDIAAGMAMSQVWRAFAWDEMQQRYQRSVFGVLWIVIAYAFFVAGVAVFFAEFAAIGPDRFVMYVALGYATYQFLVGNVVDGCQVFSSSTHWIKSTAMPYSIYVYKSIFRSLFPFVLQLLVAFALMIAFGWRPSVLALLAAPALAAFMVNAVALQYLLGLVAARYRDVGHLVSTITRILIFMTPILWVREERTGLAATLSDINPLTHYIETFRSPLLGAEPRLLSWAVVIGSTALIWAAAAVASARMRRRLPFWI